MPLQQLTRDDVRRAQELVGRIRGVTSCHISTNNSGEITEVHVVSTSDKSPKFIARDVETCLKAEMNLDVDHRTIGVVLFDQTEGEEPDPTVQDAVPAVHELSGTMPGEGDIVEFPVEEYASRISFHSVNIYFSDDTTRAEVELSRDGDAAFGSAQTDKPALSPLEVIAEATLEAVSDYLDEVSRLCLLGVRRVAFGDTTAIVVRVDLVNGRDRKALAGTSVDSGNENQTVVFATLDAINRVLGKLDVKSSVEYKIK